MWIYGILMDYAAALPGSLILAVVLVLIVLILTYSGHITSNMTITALDFKNFTTSNTSGTITIGNYTEILAGDTYEYNLTTPINVSPGDITVKLVYLNDSIVDTTGSMSVEIYGYNVSASGNYITE